MNAFFDALGQPHVQLLLRLVLGGLLVLAGVTKLAGFEAFRAAVAEYKVLPARIERPFATGLPVLEIALGALLLLGLGSAAAAALAAALFLSFSAAIGINLMRGRHFDCHCFGAVQSDQIGWPALTRSLLLAVAALTVAAGSSGFGALETAIAGSSQGLPPAAEVIPVVFMALVVLNVLVLLPETLSFRATFARVNATRITGGALHDHNHNGRRA